MGDFGDFFGGTRGTFHDRPEGVTFTGQPGYLAGATRKVHHSRRIQLVVFKSEKAALAAMEYRRTHVAAVIRRGEKEPTGLVKYWWFSEPEGLLVVVHRNLIVELVDPRYPYPDMENEFWSTMGRIVALLDEQALEIASSTALCC